MKSKATKKNNKGHSSKFLENLPFSIIQKSFESSSIGIVVTDFMKDDNPVIYVNPHFEFTTGYKLKEVVGKNCRFLQGDDTEQENLNIVRRAIKDGKSCNTVLRNYRKDGSLFYNDITLLPIYDNGQVKHFVAFQKDVSAVKVVEKKNEELNSLAQYRSKRSIEFSTEDTWRIDFVPPISLNDSVESQIEQAFENGIYVEANDHTAITYGFKKAEELIGRHISDFFSSKIPDNVEAIRELVEANYSVRDVLTYEKTVDGDDVVLLNNGNPSIKDNKVISVWGLTKNVTDIFLLNNELKISKNILAKQKKELEKKNIALREVIHQVEDEKKFLENKLIANIETFILPSINKLKLLNNNGSQLKLLQDSIKNLTSDFGLKIRENKNKLTSREIEISNMVKNGLSNKEISNLLNIALHTVEKHRRTVRVKLGLAHKKGNLYEHLNSL
jgi:PAS domain S-box-containing protein